jgi:subtilisin family serine protease
VKVLDDGGSGSDSAVIAGLDWVYSRSDPQIRVVNMSLGRDKVDGDMALDSPMRAAIRQLYAKGIIVVAAAGNEAAKEVIQKVPAGFPEVLAVASTTAKDGSNACRLLQNPIRKDTASFFTTDGSLDSTPDGLIGVTISAPGEDQENVSRGCLISSVGILSLKAGGGTIRYSGTSMAAPHVTGIVARVLQKGLAVGPEGVRGYLQTNASAKQTAPLDSPTSSYSFDGEREGVAVAP